MEKPKPIRITPALWILNLILILDQVTKIVVRRYMPHGDSFTIWQKAFGETFRLSHVSNDGSAFSFSPFDPTGNRIFFIVVTILGLCLIGWLLKKASNRFQVIIYGFILGGALGNLIDRIAFGKVTDFIDVDFPDFIMQRWPVFNIADSAIVIAMILLIIELFIHREPRTAEVKHSDQTESENK